MSSPFFPPTRFGGRNRAGKLGSLGLVILAAFLLSACSNLGAWDLIARDGRSCKKRIEIDLSALAQATTLNDFPVLVELTSAWFPYSLSSSNGYDIRFSAADGSTPLQFERESWNPGGTSLFWVKVPSLAASPASTSIWIYFDSTYPEDLSDPPAVWSNGYVGVWHGSVETVGGLPAYPDSTGKNDGSAPGPYSAAQASPNGYVGGGWAFTGTKDAVVLAAASDLADLGPLTFEAWFYDSGSAVGAMLLSKGTGASGDYLGLTVKTGRSLSLTVPYGSSALTITSPASLWVASTWSDIGLSWDGSDGSAGCVFFANGASETPSGSTPGSGARVSDAGYQMVFGNTYTPPISNPISGILDEVRLSNVARSADWMKAEYLAQQGSHLSFGTVQMRRNKHQAVAMAAVLATAFLGAASAAPTATSAPTASSALGVELGFLSVPLATPDPYSFASSVGLWYERSLGRDSPWVAGIWLALAGFHSLDSDFGDSLMYYGGLELGYRLELFDFEDSAAAIRPLLRLGWYARDIEFLGRTDWGSRPILSAGCLVELRWRALDLGWLALLSAPMDNRPVLLVGVLQRVGLCF